MNAAVTYRRAATAEVIPLRAAILRPGLPLASSHYPIDPLPTTLHAGAFLSDNCIAVATLFPEPFENQPAYRLRGMAVHPAYQRTGVGCSLLTFLLSQAPANTTLFWCNARLPAVPFYQSQGWQIAGPLFDIPEASGPHHRMSRTQPSKPAEPLQRL